MAIKTIKYNKIEWHHIDKVDSLVLKFLKREFKFHPLDIKDVQGEAEESKVDIYKNYLFLVLHFPVIQSSTRKIGFVEMDIFLGPDFLITIQKGKFKPMRSMYYKMQNNLKYKKSCFEKNTGYLLYRILEILYSDTKNITNYVVKKLRALEDEVYSNEIDEDTARQIAYLRQKVLALKRIFDPQIEVLTEMSQLKTRFLSEELNVYFDDIDDKVDKITNFLDNMKYVLKDLLEVHDSLVTHKTNKVIKILTIFSVAMLPLTLLSGIYGMNIKLPFSQSSDVIWLMFLFLFVVILGVVGIMKKRKLL